jgi:hypothetical protein
MPADRAHTLETIADKLNSPSCQPDEANALLEVLSARERRLVLALLLEKRCPALKEIKTRVERMSGYERLHLLAFLENRPDLFGEIVILLAEVVERMIKRNLKDMECMAELWEAIDARGYCSTAKKQKTAKRNALIDQAIAAGTDKDNAQAIFEFVRQEDATLLFKSKRSKKPDMDPKMMMLMYWRSKGGKNNCNRSE